MTTELAKLTDEQADDMFEISKVVKDLTAPPEVQKIFASVVGREVGARPPSNSYKKALGL